MAEEKMQSPPPQLAPDQITRVADTGLIVDLRPPAGFAGGHVPGSVSLAPGGGAGGGDGSRARAVLALATSLGARDNLGSRDNFGSRDRTPGSGEAPRDDPASEADHPPLEIYLLSPNLALAHRVAAQLTRITGLDVAGILPASALAAWAAGGGRMRTIGRITPAELADRRAVESVEVVDASEIETLLPRHAELDPDGTVVVAESGAESVADPGPVIATTAASILLALGRRGEVLVLGSSGEGGAGSPPG